MAPQPRSAKVHLHGSAAACSWGADTHWVISWIVATPASSLVRRQNEKINARAKLAPQPNCEQCGTRRQKAAVDGRATILRPSWAATDSLR